MEEQTHYNKLIIRDLRLDMFIGVLDFEKTDKQTVIINIEALFDTPHRALEDKLGNTVDYSQIVDAAKDIAGRGHINLVETLAEDIAAFCLRQDSIRQVTVRVEKPEIYEEAAGVGIEIARSKG